MPTSTETVNDKNVNQLTSFAKGASIHHSPARNNSLLESLSDRFDREHGVLFMASTPNPSRGVTGIGSERAQVDGSLLG